MTETSPFPILFTLPLFTLSVLQYSYHVKPKIILSLIIPFSHSSSSIVNTMSTSLAEKLTPACPTWDLLTLEDTIAALVFGSNMIKSAGTSHAITRRLCSAVLHCPYDHPDLQLDFKVHLQPEDPAYQAHVDHLAANGSPTDHSSAVQSRREVVQHAQALCFAIEQFVVQDFVRGAG